jgi:hypothetical protein
MFRKRIVTKFLLLLSEKRRLFPALNVLIFLGQIE